MNAKKAVASILGSLPDDCTIEDVQYHLYVLQAVSRGRDELSKGKGTAHATVARNLRQKWRRRIAR